MVTPLHRNRDFVLLWSGQIVSSVGSAVSSVAFPLFVLALTDSPARAGIVGFAGTLPFLLFELPAGGLVDRWDRKRTMIVSDALRGAALGSIAVAYAAGVLTFVQVAVVAFAEGTLFVLFLLAERTALPHVVAPEQLPAALAQNEARTRGATLAGNPRVDDPPAERRRLGGRARLAGAPTDVRSVRGRRQVSA